MPDRPLGAPAADFLAATLAESGTFGSLNEYQKDRCRDVRMGVLSALSVASASLVFACRIREHRCQT
jgi:hypothetical protein